MLSCWNHEPNNRPNFSLLRQLLSKELENIIDDCSYLQLDSQKDYYNMLNNNLDEKVKFNFLVN